MRKRAEASAREVTARGGSGGYLVFTSGHWNNRPVCEVKKLESEPRFSEWRNTGRDAPAGFVALRRFNCSGIDRYEKEAESGALILWRGGLLQVPAPRKKVWSVEFMGLLRRLGNRKGISLVEVLVALTVFVVGILAVVRMFPSGFVTVKHSENVTLADRLAQTEIERWRNRAANLPAGILPWGWDPITGQFTVLPDTDPGDLRDPAAPSDGWPVGFDIYYHTDANKFRRIHAEVTKIPVPSSMNWGYGSVYILGFSPILVDTDNNDTILVYSGPMRRRPLPRNLFDLKISASSQYVMDYDDYDGDGEAAAIYVSPAPYGRDYVLTYSYWQQSLAGTLDVLSVVSQVIPVPAANQAQIDQGYQVVPIPDPENPTVLLKDRIGFVGIDRGSDSLHRAFTELPLGTGWDQNDPYQFQVASTAAGVLLFNPAGYRYEEQTTRGKEPLTAYIDYTVLDWHIISEERKVADVINTPADGEVKLSLSFLKKAGETVEWDGGVYAGLAPSQGLSGSVLAVDMETGDFYNEHSTIPAGWANAGQPVLKVDYRKGIVEFDEAYEGHAFRIYYRAQGDWAVQTFKTYDVYRRSYGPPETAPPGYREYYYDSQRFDTREDYRVYFPRCYAGGIVAVDYRYEATKGTEPAEQHTVYGDSCQVSLDTGNWGLCYVDLLPRIERLHPPGAKLVVKEVSRVHGISVGARVIWHESGTALKAGTWKRKELQTCLIRAGD